MQALGIDIGGSGVKGAVVDTLTGEMVNERIRIKTPQPSTPQAVVEVVAEIVDHFDWHGPVGCGFPGLVLGRRTIHSTANVDDSWMDLDAATLFEDRTGCPVSMINDADAAGLAEMRFGAGRDRLGVVFVLTLGTGIGTALFTDGRLVPNVELGHMKIRGKDAEHRASDAVRRRKSLGWKAWGKRLTEYFAELEFLFTPTLFIVGGGVSRKSEKFLKHIQVATEIVPARLGNNAGIIGAALSVPQGEPVAELLDAAG